MSNAVLVECVPNISEGRNLAQVERVVDAIRRVAGISVLHIDSDADANRTVLTFVGSPGAIEEGCFELYRACFAYLDMRQHQGVHPRLGAVDVCPLVPLLNTSMEECRNLSHRIGTRLAQELGLTGYYYEHSALNERRRALPTLRKGQFESLPERFTDAQWAPDFGSFPCDLRFGATILGAREILVAFNVTLETQDQTIAEAIAGEIRSATLKQPTAQSKKPDGAHRLAKLRAIGWYLERRGHAQVSCNLLDYRVTSPFQVFTKISERALEYGTRVLGSELIGLIPETALTDAGTRSGLVDSGTSHGDELLKAGVHYLGLELWGAFSLEQRVLDKALRRSVLPDWPQTKPVVGIS